MSDLLIIQKVFRHYRRDFYEGLLSSRDINIICFGEQNEIDELIPIFNHYKFNIFSVFAVFSINLLVAIYKSETVVFPADLRYPQFIILGYVAKLLGKKVYFLGHFQGKRPNRFIKWLRKIYYCWPFRMLIYYEKELGGQSQTRVYPLNNTVNTNTIDEILADLRCCNSNNDKLNVAFIGRETDKSNYEFFVNVSERLKESDIIFKSIGPNKLGLDSIQEFGPVFDERAIAAIFEEVDLVFYAGDVGLSLIHSFYYAIPVLIHNSMSLHYPEVTAFEEGHNGLCYEHNSIDSAVCVLKHLSSNQAELLEMSQYLARTRSNYSVNTMIYNFKLAVNDAHHTRN